MNNFLESVIIYSFLSKTMAWNTESLDSRLCYPCWFIVGEFGRGLQMKNTNKNNNQTKTRQTNKEVEQSLSSHFCKLEVWSICTEQVSGNIIWLSYLLPYFLRWWKISEKRTKRKSFPASLCLCQRDIHLFSFAFQGHNLLLWLSISVL